MEPARSNGKTENPLDDNAIQALEKAFQQDITNPIEDTHNSGLKVVSVVIVLILISGIGILYLSSTLSNKDQLSGSNIIPVSDNAVVRLGSSNKEIKDIYGKVFTVKDQNVDFRYELVKLSGEKMGYLTSEKLDLSLVEGMTVYVDGKIDKMINDIPVIVVESIEFSN